MRRDLIALPDDSKVWIYQSSKPIPDDNIAWVKQQLYDFTMQWQSHGVELDCYANLFHDRFLVIVADSSSLPSGCSIDSSVHFIQGISQKLDKDLMDRMTFYFLDGDKIDSLNKNQFADAYATGKIGPETLVFDNLVNNKAEFLTTWLKPLKDSWHNRFI